MALAGLRALLLQALHPLAMAGVAAHSDFREDPWGRLFRTADYVGVTTFGTTVEARRAGAKVRGIHRRLRGVEPESGQAYRVDDPELLRWVHCVEVESFLSTAVRCGLRLSPAEQDRYYAEQTVGATLVGLDASYVPSSVREMEQYFADVRPQLRATRAARDVAAFVLWPPMPALVSSAPPRARVGGPARRPPARCCPAGRAGCTGCPGCRRPTSRPPQQGLRSAAGCSSYPSGCGRDRT
jgi:uncharacterized protein (DUF2236 family)